MRWISTRGGMSVCPQQHVYTVPADSTLPAPRLGISLSAAPPRLRTPEPSVGKELIFRASQTKPSAEPTQTLGGRAASAVAGVREKKGVP